MRTRGKKWSALVRKFGPLRREYVESHRCAITGLPAFECHECAAGVYREAAYQERCAWLAVCRTGHEYIQGRPYAEQLARKLLQDPEGFDRSRFCTQVLGRADTAVTAEEVLEEVRKILCERSKT